MQGVRQLIRIRHGSHLYGTNTPASDLDYKGVHLPSGRAILQGKPENVIDRRVKLSDTVKNQAGDVDDQSYSLAKWLGMVACGDTVGTEILFAPQSAIVEMDPLWPQLQIQARALLNKKVNGFVSYYQRQAAKYGVKGSRMAACKDIIDLLAVLSAGDRGSTAKLEEFSDVLFAFCEEHEFSSIVPIQAQANGPVINHLEVVDRKVPFTNTLATARSIYQKVYDNYGHRARAAMSNEGIDWKAMSHAVRVAGQALEFLRNGEISFPRVEAPLLLQIKLGEIPFDDVSKLLERLVDELAIASQESSLPDSTNTEEMMQMVEEYHYMQVVY